MIDTLLNVRGIIKKDSLHSPDAWRKQFSEKSVKKTVTIPAWLNYKAEEAGVNFSQELQNALKQRLQIAL